MQRASTPAAFAAVIAANFNKMDAAALAGTYPADAVLNLVRAFIRAPPG